jgi:putative transposase
MARLPRLVLPGHPHYVIQRGHSGSAVFVDDDERRSYLAALREACGAHHVTLYAYALEAGEAHLLVAPPSAEALSRMMQALGRRFVSAHRQRHGGSGALWDGRFRCAVLEPGSACLRALRHIDGLGGSGAAQGSAPSRLGRVRDGTVTDPPEYWGLGNTPFEREMAYAELLGQGLPTADAQAIRAAALGGWAYGSAAFLQALAASGGRAPQPRPRGRPPRKAPIR